MRFALLFCTWTLLVVVAFFGALEFFLEMLLVYPPQTPNLLVPLQRYYLDHDRKILQYQPECYDYDSSFTYRMRPAGCFFGNREFATNIHANSQGLRGIESDLSAPSIIVTGDSFAHGWGVNNNETFASILQTRTGKRVLNASSPSFGTAREMLLVEKQDLSALEWLIIQYCSNDITENKEFDSATGTIKIMPREKYEQVRRDHLAAISYYTGKHLLKLFPALTRNLALQVFGDPSPEPSALQKMPDAADHAKLFLQILSSSSVVQRSPRIVVVHLDVQSMKSDLFIAALEREKANGAYPKAAQEITTLDLSQKLGPEEYFRLDDHINARGHAIVAQELGRIVMDSVAGSQRTSGEAGGMLRSAPSSGAIKP